MTDPVAPFCRALAQRLDADGSGSIDPDLLRYISGECPLQDLDGDETVAVGLLRDALAGALEETVAPLRTALTRIRDDLREHMDAHLVQIPGEAVPTFDDDPEWIVISDAHDTATAALREKS